jgi:hypothetical protein
MVKPNARLGQGRKNYLFAGSDLGGERAAVIYSLIGSAKLNGLDPEAYLRTVLAQIGRSPITHSIGSMNYCRGIWNRMLPSRCIRPHS